VAGNVILEPSFFVDAPARLPTRAGPHRIEGLDAAGLPLFSLGFDGEVVPDLPRGEERHFAFVVPLGAAEEVRLARLRLTGHGLTALRGAVPGSGPGTAGSVSRVSVERSAGGTTLGWNPAFPMALIRDSRTGEVIAFARGGRARLEGLGPSVQVELSDGVRSLPRVTIVRP
jgi:hypothetical protein